MFSVLFVLMVLIDMVIHERTGVMYTEDTKVTFIWLGINLILSILLINLWDHASNVMKDSESVLWRVFRGIVVATSWVLTAIIALFIVFGILLDMDSQGFFNTNFIIIVLAIWGVASIVSAIKS